MKTRIVWLTIALALGGSIALWCWAFASTGVAQDTPRPLPLVTPRNDAADEMPLVEPPKGEYGLITPREVQPPRVQPEPFNGCAYNRGYRDGFKAGLAERAKNGAFLNDEHEQLLNIAVISCVAAVAFIFILLLIAVAVLLLPRIGRGLCLLLCCFALCASGCSAKTEPRPGVGSASEPAVIEAPVPVPPLKQPEQSDASGVPFQQAQAAQPQGTPLIVDDPVPSSSGPRHDDPTPLADLLDMRSVSSSEDESAVKKMRPSAIREAAHMVTLQTAIAWRYGQLLDAVGRHGAIMDTAFNFGPLMMTQGDALIMPPVLTRAGASLRIDDEDTATSSATTYELLQKARYVSVVPHWRAYLMADGGLPAPEQPNPAVLPKNGKERDIWRAAVREAWAQGVDEADALFVDNVSRMVRDYRGVMLYHLLTAQHLLSRVGTSSAMLGSRVSGNKMALGQHVYRITNPSAFTPPTSKSGKAETRKRRRR